MVRIVSPEVQAFEKEHLATLRSLAPECMVLLKKNGDFPLSEPCKAALYGAGARDTIKGGTGSGDVNVRHYVTVEEGLENAGFTVTTKSWMDGYKAAREAVIQGFYEGIAREAKVTSNPSHKNQKKVNLTVAIDIARDFFREIKDTSADILDRISRYIEAYRPGRRDTRKKIKPKSFIPFIYRVV